MHESHPALFRVEGSMTLGYCHEKLSLAVFEVCRSTAGLKARLRTSLKHGFTAFPDDIFTDVVRQQLSEVKVAFAEVQLTVDAMNPPDALDRMKPSEVRRLVDRVINLREAVAQEYFKQKFRR
jgi:hypothetical protein